MTGKRCKRCRGLMLPEWLPSERCPDCMDRLASWGRNDRLDYARLTPADSATPIADYRDGRMELAHAALRFVQLCNGVDAQFVGDEFNADKRERNVIAVALSRYVREGRIRVEHDWPNRRYFPIRKKARVA